MIQLAKVFYFIFGIITLAGGIQGFLKGSTASLVAGGIAGALLIVAGALIATAKTTPGLVLGLIITLGLAGRFLPAFLKSGAWWPAGVEGILGVIGLIVSVVALIKK